MSDWPFDYDNRKFKLILPAGEIPLGATVSKVTGKAQYTLGVSLKVYGLHKLNPNQTEPTEIKAGEGVVFLIDSGKANAISTQTELIWYARADEVDELINPPETEQ